MLGFPKKDVAEDSKFSLAKAVELSEHTIAVEINDFIIDR